MADNDKKKAPERESRIDEFAAGMFVSMGYELPLSDSIVNTYREFKVRKDKLQPGRLSPEGFAMVAFMADLTDGKITLPKSAE